MFRRGERPVGDKLTGDAVISPSRARHCPQVRRKTARTRRSESNGGIGLTPIGLQRFAQRRSGIVRSAAHPDSAAPLGDAEGKQAPGEAPVLACPAANPPGERKRADDSRLIGRGGALDGGAHQEARTAAARSQVRGTSREPFAISCDPIGKGESRGTQHSMGRSNQATKPIRRLVPPVKTANGCETSIRAP
jgi:hypothetical protein